MTDTALAVVDHLLGQAFEALDAVVASGDDAELVAVLRRCEGAARRLDRAGVAAVAGLQRRGVFAEKGYASPAAALADLLGCDRFEARRRVVAAEQIVPRTGVDGAVLPARLPDTAEAFAAGRAGLRHVEAVAQVLAAPAARRLAPAQWAGVEEQLAAKAEVYTPAELRAWGRRAGGAARPGRRRARRAHPCTGQRAAPDPVPVRGREAQGPVRRRGDVRRDRHADRRAREAAGR
jgi:5-methylcytosine-specific restriction protein A